MANLTAGIYTDRRPTTVLPTAKPECCCPACVGLRCLDRTRFFSGQLLTESDLNNEQSYWLAKSRLHNRYLHGWGVVCGLRVVCSDCEGWVTVKSGYALDPCGNDIIVCEDQPFNLIKAIESCCTPKKMPDCSPLRYTPSPTCQDVEQTWCITIEYLEQPSRLITPLQPPTAKGKECDCDCGAPGGKHRSSCRSCCCPPSNGHTTHAAPVAACEPTRINEGFKLCVIPAPAENRDEGPKPGTMGYEIALCLESLQQLMSAVPHLTGPPPMTPAQAYQAVCKFLSAVRDALSNTYVTHCQIESALNQIQIPPPDNSNNYLARLQTILENLLALIRAAALDCICTAFIPPCSTDPCDDRLILACVTVRNGKIINICHFGGRKQVITFPTVYYWLSFFGLDKVVDSFITNLGQLCCGPEKERQMFFGAAMLRSEPLTSAGFSNPAMISRVVANSISQKLGANLVNAASPLAQAIDLRPYLGQNLEEVKATLARKYKFSAITTKDVSSDPAWNEDAVATSALFAPAAFSLTQPLTVYTTGEQQQIVGFEITDPTEARIEALQKQVDQLHKHVTSLRGKTGGSTRTKRTPPDK